MAVVAVEVEAIRVLIGACDMEAGLLEHLPNGGAVVAIVTVVVLFLKHQERRDDRMEGIVDRFSAEIAQSRRDYLDQLNRSARGAKPGQDE